MAEVDSDYLQARVPSFALHLANLYSLLSLSPPKLLFFIKNSYLLGLCVVQKVFLMDYIGVVPANRLPKPFASGSFPSSPPYILPLAA